MISDKNFRDWHGEVFGYGYGSGEEYWLPALHEMFTTLIPEEGVAKGVYDHMALEQTFGGLGAWLLINALCAADVIEYGTSPRFGWLTPIGEMLREYIKAHTVDELKALAADTTDSCFRDWCNCNMTKKPCNPLFGAEVE